MSHFSEVLSNLVKDKNADIQQMSSCCNFDRSNMYKILKGRRNPPSLETVYKICDFLRLTPSERKLLDEAWHITILGTAKYFRRKSVEHFLLSFPEDFSSTWNQSSFHQNISSLGQDLSSLPPSLALETQMDINSLLLRMLSAESVNENGCISIVAQPDYDFLIHTLTGLAPNKTLTVEHIFCLNQTTRLTEDNHVNHIKYLEAIMPLLMTTNLAYCPLYHYGNIPDQFNSFSLMACMILSSEYVMLCTSDFQQGIFFNDLHMVSTFQESFSCIKEKCSPLFQISNVDLTHFEQYLPIRTLMHPGDHTYIIQEEGCLLPLIPRSVLQDFLDPSTPNKDVIAKLYGASEQDAREEMKNQGETWLHQFFTRNGILYFVRTGQFRELPSQFCKPLPKESRIYLLTEFIKFCRNGLYRMLKAPLENLSGNLRLAVFDKLGYLVLSRADAPLTYLLFDEPHLLEIFIDYMSSLDSYCYSAEATVDYIQDMIDSLR